MAGTIYHDSNLDIIGDLKVSSVPNSTGSVVTWNSSTNVFGLRTNAQIITDLGLATQTWANAQGWIKMASIGNGNISYTGTGSITGGGTSTANQAGNTNFTFDLTPATKTGITQGQTAFSWGRGLRVDGNGVPTGAATIAGTIDVVRNASMYASSSASGKPGGLVNEDVTIVNFTSGTANIGGVDRYSGFDLVSSATTDQMWFRRENMAAGKSPWLEFIHSGNIGSYLPSLVNYYTKSETNDNFHKLAKTIAEATSAGYYNSFALDSDLVRSNMSSYMGTGSVLNSIARVNTHLLSYGTNANNSFQILKTATSNLAPTIRTNIGGSWTSEETFAYQSWVTQQITNAGGNYITTNTTQTGLSGNKTTSGIFNFDGTNVSPITLKRNQSNNLSIRFNDLNNGGFNVGMLDKNVFSINSSPNLGGVDWWMRVDNTGLVSAKAGFAKTGATNADMLLGAGGHRPVSDFALAGSLGNYLPLTGGTMSGAINTTFSEIIKYNGVTKLALYPAGTVIGGGNNINFRPNGVASAVGEVTINSAGTIITTTHGASTDWNNIRTKFLGASSINIPSGTTIQSLRTDGGTSGNYNYAPVLHLGASDTAWQLQADYGSDRIQFRGGFQGGYRNWRTIWHDGNLPNPATQTWVTNNFANNTALGNYVNKAGDTMSDRISMTPQGTYTNNIHRDFRGVGGGSYVRGIVNVLADNNQLQLATYVYNQIVENFYIANSDLSGTGIEFNRNGTVRINDATAPNHAVAFGQLANYALLSQVPTNNNQLANGANYTTLPIVQSWISTQGYTNTTVGVNSGNFTSGQINIVQGTNIVVTKSGNTISISSTNSGGGGITNIATDDPNLPGPTSSNMPIVFNSHVAYGKPETAIDDREVGNGQIQVESGDVVRFHHSFDNVMTFVEDPGKVVAIDIDGIRKHIINVVFMSSGSGGSGGTVTFTSGIYTGDQINITVPRGQAITLQPQSTNLTSSSGQEVFTHANLIWDAVLDSWVLVSYG